jgi:hypothetical protein
VIAIAISSIIPGVRARASRQPPVRNGCPPQTNRVVPSTGPTHSIPGKSSSYPNQSITMWLVTTRGTVSTRLHQNLRRNIST